MKPFFFFLRRTRDDAAFMSTFSLALRPLRSTSDDTAAKVIASAANIARSTYALPVPPPPPHTARRPRLLVLTAAVTSVAVVAAITLVIAPQAVNNADVFDETRAMQTAIVPGFSPTPMPSDRGDDYVIITLDTRTAEIVDQRLAANGQNAPYVLAQRPDEVTVSLQMSALTLLDDLSLNVTPDTRVTASNVSNQSPVPSWGLDRIDA